MREDVVKLLLERGIRLDEIAEIVYYLQNQYTPNLTMDLCLAAVEGVICKREIQYAVLTGIALDILAEQKKLPWPLQEIIENDEPLYGIDEVLALGITNIYGSIGFTSFGFLDKQKIGVIGRLHYKKDQVHTFLDDIIAAIASAAAAKIAHNVKQCVFINVTAGLD